MKLFTDKVVKIYRSRTVVNSVSVEVSQGEIVGLLGPNGAGKTTTFYMVVGIIKPNSGRVFMQDGDTVTEITRLPMYRRAQLGVGYLAQEASVFRQMSVEDNIASILEFRKDLDKEQQRAKLESLLDEFRLQHIRRSKGIQLSGGERRRTEIARALANDPMFLLLDEPFAGVDPIAVADIQDIIAYLRDRGMGILITDHNVRETLRIVDRAYIMNDGEILIEGDRDVIAGNELARKYYLGDNFTL